MEIKAGKSYHIHTPNSNSFEKKSKVHIDYILDNPSLDPIYKDIDDYKLIVYRIWIKHKKCFKHYINPYYILCLWNNWPYNNP
jgi:hypothetical protein